MDKDWLRVLVMLSLTEEIHGHPIWIHGWLNIDENFRWPGDHINPHLAEDLPFCSRHPGIARSNDLINW